MKVICDISLTSATRRFRPWSPAALFADGAQGVWYDPSDISTLFQDDSGTMPATADGDSVALVQDKSGNGLDMVQSLASRRPVLRRSGTLIWLEFDGIDDRLDCPSLSYASPFTGAVMGIKYAPGDTAYGTLRGVSSASPNAFAGLSSEVDGNVASFNVGNPVLTVNAVPASNFRNGLRAALTAPSVLSATNIDTSNLTGRQMQLISYLSHRAPAADFYGYVEVDGMTQSDELRAINWLNKRMVT